MTIVEINGNNYGSAGNIMMNVASCAREKGYKVITCCKNSKQSRKFDYQNQIYIGYRLERLISEQLAAISGYSGYFNIFGTLKFIRQLKKIRPSLIHLHVMHESYINIPILFSYIKKNRIPVVWTLHDTWPFTGKCPGFDFIKCYKWKEGCNNCPDRKNYPISYFFDKTKFMWKKKKEWFAGLNNSIMVTPSKWLSDYVKLSFLSEYEVVVINNGIDLNVFKPKPGFFKKNHKLDNNFIVLGVANRWSDTKGLSTFIELSNKLPEKYKIVLVGTDKNIDQILPEKIISINRTYNVTELIEIYSDADVFVNPTVKDNFPTVNIEALACGTPVITYKTGGSPEIIDDNSGVVLEQNDIEGLADCIVTICERKPFKKEDCVDRAKMFDYHLKLNEYVAIFDSKLRS